MLAFSQNTNVATPEECHTRCEPTHRPIIYLRVCISSRYVLIYHVCRRDRGVLLCSKADTTNNERPAGASRASRQQQQYDTGKHHAHRHHGEQEQQRKLLIKSINNKAQHRPINTPDFLSYQPPDATAFVIIIAFLTIVNVGVSCRLPVTSSIVSLPTERMLSPSSSPTLSSASPSRY